MINTEDGRVSGDKERSEVKTDFQGLGHAGRKEHRSQRVSGGRGAEVRRRRGGKLESSGTN